MKRLDKATIDKAIELKRSGLSYDETARSLRISPATVQYHVSKSSTKELKRCDKCGATSGLVKHHYDYSTDKTFVLCVKCHAKIHTYKRNKFWVGYENIPNSKKSKASWIMRAITRQQRRKAATTEAKS